MIPKSCAKLAQVSFVQIPGPVSIIITLNRVYKKVCKVNLQKKSVKLSTFLSKYAAAWNTEKQYNSTMVHDEWIWHSTNHITNSAFVWLSVKLSKKSVSFATSKPFASTEFH